jgi:hypothetical protein
MSAKLAGLIVVCCMLSPALAQSSSPPPPSSQDQPTNAQPTAPSKGFVLEDYVGLGSLYPRKVSAEATTT